jgi:Protein of unknown function (DUF2845)
MRITTTIWALLVMLPGVCLSDGMYRCGNSLVSADVSVAELLKKCGQPTSQHTSTQDVYNEHGVKVAVSKTEVWRYERGYSAPPMVVTIVDGQIQSIEGSK